MTLWSSVCDRCGHELPCRGHVGISSSTRTGSPFLERRLSVAMQERVLEHRRMLGADDQDEDDGDLV